MFWADFLLSFLVAIVFSLILVGLLGRRYPGYQRAWPGIFFFFLVLFLAAWAGGVYLYPAPGEVVWSTYWIPFIIVGAFVALLIAALIPAAERKLTRTEEEAARTTDAEGPGVVALGIFFWILMATLLVALIVYYT